MNYLAILGRQPEFGLIELESVLGQIQTFGTSVALIPKLPNINMLGGTIKLGHILWRGPAQPLDELPGEIDTLAKPGKTTFGLSIYGQKFIDRDVLQAGLALKKRLRGAASARFVAPQGGQALSVAQVKFNRLLELGFELLIALHGDQMIIATTVAIQDIDAYSARDYQRPARNATVGMLPPKLAQIMINTTPPHTPVYDPFCGTGVILQEALLMGRQAAGSDLSADMVQASQTNLKWLAQSHRLPDWALAQSDARELVLSDGSWSIVSEGYLGPNLTKNPSDTKLADIRTELQTLYISTLSNFARQLPAGGRLTITQPAWQGTTGPVVPLSIDLITDMSYTINRFAAAGSHLPIYRRPGQLVGRQLLILRKN